MGQFAPSLPAGGIMFDSNTPGFLGPAVINTYTALTIPAYWRAMNFIAANMASFPRYVAKDSVKTNHRLNLLLSRRPNANQSATTFWQTLFFHRAHYANGYATIERDSQFAPAALVNRPPETVMPFRWIGEDTKISTYYAVTFNNGGPTFVPAADMIHLSGISYDGVAGLNPVTMLYEGFERARQVDRFMTRFLTKGTVIKGAIEIPTGVSEAQQKAVVSMIQQNFVGANAERDVLVLTEGAKLNNATMTPQESQLIEQAAYTTKQIAQITGVPPAFLFDLTEGKYNTTAEQAGQTVVRDLFRPLIVQAEDELSLKLLKDSEWSDGYSIAFDPSALIRGDTKTTSDTIIEQKNAGIRTANEAREVLGLPDSTDPDAGKLITLGNSAGQNVPADHP